MSSCIALGTIVTLSPLSWGIRAPATPSALLGRLQMNQLKSRDEFAPETLRARVDAWVERTGRKELVRTIESAEEARDSIRAVLRVDQQTLNNPVTL